MSSTPTAPRVTVAIPTYNRAELLREAIGSVLAQTYRDFVLVVSDNASTDHTRAVVTAVDDPRVRYVRRADNLGLVGNWNACMAEAETEYVIVLSDDDLLRADYLAEAVAALEAHPRAGIVHTRFSLIDGEGVELGVSDWTYGLGADTVETPAEFIRESMAHSCRVCTSTALMRVEAIPPGGMRAEEHPAVDFGMWLRMAAAGWQIAFLAKPLAAYRIHGGSFSAAAYGPPQAAGYVYSPDAVARVHAVKLAFLRDHPDGLGGDPHELESLAAGAARLETVVLAYKRTLDRADLSWRRVRFVSASARMDPRTLVTPYLWRTLAVDLRNTLLRRDGRARRSRA